MLPTRDRKDPQDAPVVSIESPGWEARGPTGYRCYSACHKKETNTLHLSKQIVHAYIFTKDTLESRQRLLILFVFSWASITGKSPHSHAVVWLCAHVFCSCVFVVFWESSRTTNLLTVGHGEEAVPFPPRPDSLTKAHFANRLHDFEVCNGGKFYTKNSYFRYKYLKGFPDGSTGKDPCHQGWWPKFSPWKHTGGREIQWN